MEDYLINIEYRVSKDWFTDVREVIYTDMHFCKHVTWYNIEFWNHNKTTNEEIWKIKVRSTINKEELQKYLDGHSTRAEIYKVI